MEIMEKKIPSGWRVEDLSDVVTVINGKAHEPYVVGYGGPYVVVNSKFVSSEGSVKKYCSKNITPAKKEDVLMVLSDLPNGKALAKCFFVERDNVYAVNQRVCAFRTGKKIYPKYLYYKLNRNEYFLKFDDGVSQTHLLVDTIDKCPVVFPESRDEQKAIANTLTDIDNYITALDKLIEKKKKIKIATMQQLLSGEVRLGGYNDEWRTTTIGQLVDFYHGRGLPKSDLVANGKRQCIHYGQLFTEYYEQIDTVASSTNLSENIFESKENDILMPTSDVTPRGLATASCIKKSGIILGGGILVLRPKKDVNGSFISYFISNNKNEVLKLVKGSTVFHLYARDITNLEVKLPTSIAEQNEIVEVLEDMKNEITSLQEKRDKLAEMKVGAMHELLTGNIRLI